MREDGRIARRYGIEVRIGKQHWVVQPVVDRDVLGALVVLDALHLLAAGIDRPVNALIVKKRRPIVGKGGFEDRLCR
jgi:hypothetical protein